MVHVAVVLALLIVILVVCYLYDKITVGGHGIWYGYEEPPEWFVGFWDKGDVVVQWPRPSTVEDLVFEGLTEEDLVVSGRPIYDDIVVGELYADKIVANSVTSEDIIPDPDFPGLFTTKQELARRRSENG